VQAFAQTPYGYLWINEALLDVVRKVHAGSAVLPSPDARSLAARTQNSDRVAGNARFSRCWCAARATRKSPGFWGSPRSQ